MPGLLILAFVVLVALGSWLWSRKVTRARIEGWSEYARTRQLGFSNQPLSIAGTLGGSTVAVLIEVRGSGKNRQEVCVVRFDLGDVLNPSFSLDRETVADKVAQLFKGQDHQLGVAQIDEAFHLDNLDDRARRVLNDRSVQLALLRTVGAYPSMRIGNAVLHLESKSVPSNAIALGQLVADAQSLATTLRRAGQRS